MITAWLSQWIKLVEFGLHRENLYKRQHEAYEQEERNTENYEVQVQQQTGKITCDFEGAKAYLSARLDEYRNVIFTEDSKKDAKATVASLRKEKKAFADKVKEVRDEYMKPLQEFADKAKNWWICMISLSISSMIRSLRLNSTVLRKSGCRSMNCIRIVLEICRKNYLCRKSITASGRIQP